MKAATFFGHRDFDYSPYQGKILEIITDLIENRGVRKFYNGFRGNFDRICAELVFELKCRYPDIKNILTLSYYGRKDFVLPKFFDESVYLLEKHVPPKYAISYTNREMIVRADFIVSGVRYHYGGAYAAWDFARRHKKMILEVVEDL